MTKQPLDFKSLSHLAAEVERAGDYSYAESVWQRAAGVAKKEVNKKWCIARAQFLNRWATRLQEAREA